MTKDKKFDILYKIQDEYLDPSLPQSFSMSLLDFEEDMDERDIEYEICNAIEADFADKISWSCDDLSVIVGHVKDALIKARGE